MSENRSQDSSAVQHAGLRALDWVYRFAQDTDPDSPEYGGVRNLYDPMRRDFVRRGHGLCLTWSACLAAFAGLAAYDLTGDDFYLDRVDLIARYVKSNQNLDQSDALRYGSFVVSRDRRFVDVPDLSWAGNLFVQLHRRTGDREYLDRAKLAADWLLQMRMPHGGFATFFVLDSAQPVDYSHASDGQHGLFLANLHDATKDDKYAEPLQPLADMLSGPGQHQSGAYYMSLRADGVPVYESWDEDAGHPLINGQQRIICGPRQNYYAALFLIEQYQRDKNQSYLDSARRCCEWSIDLFHRDGYFSDQLELNDQGEWIPDRHPDVACPSAMTRVWLPLNDVDPDPRWLDASRQAAEWTMRWQRNQPDHPDLHGAIVAEPVIVAYYVSFAAWGLLDLARYLRKDLA